MRASSATIFSSGHTVYEELILQLMKGKVLEKSSAKESVEEIIEIIDRLFRASFTSIWRADPPQNRLECVAKYDRENQFFFGPSELNAQTPPLRMEDTQYEPYIMIHNPLEDTRINENLKDHLERYAIHTMVFSPINNGITPLGYICQEFSSIAKLSGREQRFLNALASFVSLAFGLFDAPETVAQPESEKHPGMKPVVGWAYTEISYDATGAVQDAVILDLDEGFSRMMGGIAIGTRILDPAVQGSPFFIRWLGGLKERSGEENGGSFEYHSPSHDEWYENTFFSPKKGHLFSVVTDITADRNRDRILYGRNADLTRRLTVLNQALMREKKQIEYILDMISEGVVVLDQTGRITLTNRGFKKYYDEIASDPADPEENAFFKAIRELSRSDNHSLTIEPKKGLYYQLSTTGKGPMENPPMGEVVEIRDITPFIEFDNLRKKFVSTTSHELRTPISIIMQSLENLMLYRERLSQDQQNHLFDILWRNSSLMAELIEDLLSLSRIDEQQLELRWQQYKPFEVLEELLLQLEPFRREKSIMISTSVSEDLKLFGDRKAIGQVFRVLLDNALKYSDAGKQIQIEAIDNYKGRYNETEEGFVLFKFKDQGRGILKEDLPNLFDRFYRTETVRDIPGTGLGLSIAHEIVKLHKGKIFVESEFGKGSTFFVLLPHLDPRPILENQKARAQGGTG